MLGLVFGAVLVIMGGFAGWNMWLVPNNKWVQGRERMDGRDGKDAMRCGAMRWLDKGFNRTLTLL
jgi:hypothetical protein